jgi:hypothetical protein
MNSATQDLLYLMAEVAIATVALSGITMMLAISGMQLDAQRSAQITTQLRMAFIVVALALLPLLLLQFELNDALLWRIATGVYLLVIVYVTVRSALGSESYDRLPRDTAALVAIPGVGAFTLLPLNLYLAQSWPFLTQLCLAWGVSMALFIRFIYQVLADKRAQGDG